MVGDVRLGGIDLRSQLWLGGGVPSANLVFRVLGPVTITAGGGCLRLGGPGQRNLLAALLLRANRVVPIDQLRDAIWGDAWPRTAFAKIQVHVSALRHALGSVNGAPGSRQVLVTQPPGYMMAVERDQLDLSLFEALAEEGLHLLAEDAAAASASLCGALALWRGRPLEGVDLGGAFAHEAARLEERHLTVLEARIEADLRLGRHDDLIGELEALVVANPLRERLHGQLMLALYRSARRGDALSAFRRARRVLADELGLDPGHELQQLERAILRGGPGLEAPAPAPRPQPTRRLPIAQLPAAIADFTGRDEEVRGVRDSVARFPHGRASTPAMPVCVISGPVGAGKTVLAVRSAHGLRRMYRDGQLFVSLSDCGRPVPSHELLGELLLALGVERNAMPASSGERSHLYRSLLSPRRMLVLLDDATCEAQVRPLLPGSPSCAALITGRARLHGIEGASRVNLGPLPVADALELLSRVCGRDRVSREPSAAASIVDACGRLPLAVRVAGAKLAQRPHWSLARMAALLADDRRRLDELSVGDLDVRASLMLSYQGLKPELRRAFRAAGQMTGPDLTPPALAALLHIATPAAEGLLDGLVAAWLVEPSVPGDSGQARYSLDNLVRDLARDLPRERARTGKAMPARRRCRDAPAANELLSAPR